MLIVAEIPARADDEPQPEQGARQSAEGAVVHALVDQAEARREHEPGRDGVGSPEPPARGVLGEGERRGTEPGGYRREQREEEDRGCARRLHAS